MKYPNIKVKRNCPKSSTRCNPEIYDTIRVTFAPYRLQNHGL